MSLTRAKLEADLARMIADNPETLTFSDDEYQVEADEAVLDFAPDLGEFMRGDQVAVVMVNDLTATLPGEKSLVTFRGEVWRVERVRLGVDRVDRVLVLGPVMGEG